MSTNLDRVHFATKPCAAGMRWAARGGVLSRARILQIRALLRPCLALTHRIPATKRHREVNPEDHAVGLITHWLTGRIDDDAIRTGLSPEGLSGEGAEAVEELIEELKRPNASRGHLQMVARETVEALAMGG